MFFQKDRMHFLISQSASSKFVVYLFRLGRNWSTFCTEIHLIVGILFNFINFRRDSIKSFLYY